MTLAGVLGTDCVVLAGARDEVMSAGQRVRLDAAAGGGYVVGGLAAVPAGKIAGRAMTRIGGASRWNTAQLIGREAVSLAGGSVPASPSAIDGSLSIPADVRQPGVFLYGAGPWVASDCAGDTPIVVGSDAKAQSDIYSAVALAGVVGTDCVVLAGSRDGPMPPSQQERLDAAQPGGFVLGGTAAVPTAKIAGRDMTRLGGASRWETAQFVGRRASGDTAAGTSTTTEGVPTSSMFTAISAADQQMCGIRTDSTIECWNHWDEARTSPVSGTFTEVAADDGARGCGVRTNGTVECWGWPSSAPSGLFTKVVVEGDLCGIRTNGTIECWHFFSGERSSPPSGTFTAIAGDRLHACGIRTNGAVECWGFADDERTSPPSGTFTKIAVGHAVSCGIRTNGAVECWGSSYSDVVNSAVPSGIFTEIAVGTRNACGIRPAGTIECWGADEHDDIWPPLPPPPSGRFRSIAADGSYACGIRLEGAVECWGAFGAKYAG
ncbi:MAG: hypothetical protein OXB99_13430 [Acidimicrobiaceae bacterium]|nr:hypothetical protein [Acidimicrobiaceae bacterium]